MKTTIILFLSLFSIIQIAYAQGYNNSSSDIIPYSKVEQQPVFIGGNRALMEFISKNTNYPKIAKKKSIQGKVLVLFVIDINGEVTKVRVIRKVHSTLDRESIRVVKLLPDWTPGEQDGKKVPVSFIVPINYKLY